MVRDDGGGTLITCNDGDAGFGCGERSWCQNESLTMIFMNLYKMRTEGISFLGGNKSSGKVLGK